MRARPDAGVSTNPGSFGVRPGDPLARLFAGVRALARGRHATSFRHGGEGKVTLRVDFLDAARGCRRRLTLADGKTLEVAIPAGFGDGQTIRLRNQGARRWGGGRAGDALIEVRIDAHPTFRRRGNDILIEAPVTLPQAVLGGDIEVPTIDGTVALKVPKGSNTGTVLRLKGKGIVGRARGERGHQYVELKVILPDRPDPELERRIAEWLQGRDVKAREGTSPA